MKMNHRLQGFMAGVLAAFVLFGGGLYAKTALEKIEVKYDNIRVYKDRVLQSLKDAQGNIIEPFIYKGTTYVPVRAASELAGMKVEWDGATKSIYLWDKDNKETSYLMDVCPPHAGNYYKAYVGEKDTFLIGSKKHKKGVNLKIEGFHTHNANVFFNLNGEYQEVEMTVGPTSSDNERATHFEIYLDDKVVKEIHVKDGDTPQKITLSVKGALKMELRATGEGKYDWGLSIGIGDIIVR